MKIVVILLVAAIIFIPACFFAGDKPALEAYNSWTNYGGSKDGMRYSSGAQITKENVEQLRPAWSYDPADSAGGVPCNPVIIGNILYGVTPSLHLFALEAGTGKEIWRFKPINKDAKGNVRGVTYWQSTDGNDKRIFYATGPYLYSVNAADGKSDTAFGKKGFIDLRENLDGNYSRSYVSGNAPGIIYRDLIIAGMRVGEGHDAAPGHIRAYDVHTGERKWIFHTIPQPGEFGFDTWEDTSAWRRSGGANNWGGMSLDDERGIVYVPTGSATPDFYGGMRKGANLFANSLIALDAATGKYRWHFQIVHHDLWDRDLPANPNLVTIKKEGKTIDAVAQITKHGYIFLFDRETGKPVFPIHEVPVPASDLPGEVAWPTQPVPELPEPFARQQLDSSVITDRNDSVQGEMLAKFKRLRSGNLFIPPSEQGGFIFPGFDGGGQWGGAAVDPESQILYVNASELPWWTAMIENPVLKSGQSKTLKELGKNMYDIHCVHCHGRQLEGNGKLFPTLIGIEKKYTEQQARKLIDNGQNRMPAFGHLPENQKAALLAFLLNLEDKEIVRGAPAPTNSPAKKSFAPPYSNTGYNRFYDSDGYPGIKPPWGTLNAVNLSTGKLLWKVPLGEYSDLIKAGLPITGTPNYGGPVVTKGGLVFIASTPDKKLRAFDKDSGKQLWETMLTGEGRATPAVYVIDGKQYVVIACGMGKQFRYMAFALPAKQ